MDLTDDQLSQFMDDFEASQKSSQSCIQQEPSSQGRDIDHHPSQSIVDEILDEQLSQCMDEFEASQRSSQCSQQTPSSLQMQQSQLSQSDKHKLVPNSTPEMQRSTSYSGRKRKMSGSGEAELDKTTNSKLGSPRAKASRTVKNCTSPAAAEAVNDKAATPRKQVPVSCTTRNSLTPSSSRGATGSSSTSASGSSSSSDSSSTSNSGGGGGISNSGTGAVPAAVAPNNRNNSSSISSTLIRSTSISEPQVFASLPSPITEDRIVVVDTETTGFDPDDCIIEIAGIELISGEPTGVQFQAYVNATKPSCPEALNKHRLTQEFLKKHKPIEWVMRNFINWVGDSCIVAHNAVFDMRMINTELQRLGWPLLQNNAHCTMRYWRSKYPGLINGTSGLDDVAIRIGVASNRRSVHGALPDALLLTEVLQWLWKNK